MSTEQSEGHSPPVLAGYAVRSLDTDSYFLQAAPIVRVAIEARALADMGALAAGLDLLHRADPLAEVTLQPSGEHVLGAAGVHVLLCYIQQEQKHKRDGVTQA